jgi:hypothetical protein
MMMRPLDYVCDQIVIPTLAHAEQAGPSPDSRRNYQARIGRNRHHGGADALILRMLNLLLEPSGLRLAIISASGSAMHISDKIDELNTGLIAISHLPPLGLTRARDLI